MIYDEMEFSDYRVRQAALQLAIEASKHDPWSVVRLAKEFEAYLRGDTKQEPAKAA